MSGTREDRDPGRSPSPGKIPGPDLGHRGRRCIRAGEAVVGVGEGWGALSEIALAKKMGRAVMLLGEAPSHWAGTAGNQALYAEWNLPVSWGFQGGDERGCPD